MSIGLISPTFIPNGESLVVGHDGKISTVDKPEFQVLGTGSDDAAELIARFSADALGPHIDFVKSRNAAINGNAIVQDNDVIGGLRYYPDDGVDFATLAAEMLVEVDDASSAAGDIGTAFVWRSMPGGGGAIREVMRLDAAGNLTTLGALIISGDLVFPDNDAAAFGTGSDARLYYDGTDTFLNLRNVGTGDFMIALAGSFPNPDFGVHIWGGDAGVVSNAATVTMLTLETSTNVLLQFFAPTGNFAEIAFGQPTNVSRRGSIRYTFSTATPADTLILRTASIDRINISANAFAFQEATTISVSTGNLTLSGVAGSDILIGDDVTILFVDGGTGGVGIGIASVTGTRLVLPQENDASTPTWAFGDGDTGFYESADDTISIAFGAAVKFVWNATELRGASNFSGSIRNTSTTALIPTLLPDRNDSNTGIGAVRTTPDQLSLIAGGVEGIRITEVASAITLRLLGLGILGTGEGGTVAATGNTFRAPDIVTGGVGNVVGSDLTIAAGIGTGTGDVGTVIFALPIVVGAGDFIQTRATRLTLDMVGSTSVLTMSAAQALTISIATGNLTFNAAAGSEVVFNEDSADIDFRIESNGLDPIFVTDGALDTMGFGSAVSDRRFINIAGSHTFFGTAAILNIAPTLTLSDAGNGNIVSIGGSIVAASGSLFTVLNIGVLAISGTTPAEAAALRVVGPPTGATVAYSLWVDDGVVRLDGDLQIHDGSNAVHTLSVSGEVVFNETSADIDFRIESNNNTTAFQIDAALDTAAFWTPATSDIALGLDKDFGATFASTLFGFTARVKTHRLVSATTNKIIGINTDARLNATNDQNWTAAVAMRSINANLSTLGGSGVVTGGALFYGSTVSETGATFTNVYGIFLEAQTVGTNNYGIWIDTPTGTIADAIHAVGGRTFLGGTLRVDGASDLVGDVTMGVSTVSHVTIDYVASGGVRQFEIRGTGTYNGGTSVTSARVNPISSTVPNGFTVTNLVSMDLFHPQIVLGGTGAVTNAATLRIVDAPTEATNNYAFWVDSGASRFDGDVNLNSVGSLLNVGGSENDWTGTQLLHKGSGRSRFEKTVGSTVGITDGLLSQSTTSGNMADSFGAGIHFAIEDPGASNIIGHLGFEREGADNTGGFIMVTRVAGSNNTTLKVTSGGQLSVDLDSDLSASSAGSQIFDDYDDAMALQKFAYIVNRDITAEQRAANVTMMLEMGVVKRVPGAISGYHIVIQPMLRLVAGGVYQNRWAIDEMREDNSMRFSNVEERLTEAEKAIRIVRDQVISLGGIPHA